MHLLVIERKVLLVIDKVQHKIKRSSFEKVCLGRHEDKALGSGTKLYQEQMPAGLVGNNLVDRHYV